MRVPRLISPRDNELILYNVLKRVTAGLPDQTGNTGKFLTTDGTTASWLNLTGGGDMIGANNLSDVVSASTSLTNLGGLAAANNLSDVDDAPTAAVNLGLVTDFTVINDTLYPSVKAVNTQITTALATTITTLNGQTAAIGSTLLNGTDSAGSYLVNIYLVVNVNDVASVGSVDVRFAWNDSGGATFTRSVAIPFNAKGRVNHFGTTNMQGELIEVADDNGIMYSTVFTGGVILTAEYSLIIVSRKIT